MKHRWNVCVNWVSGGLSMRVLPVLAYCSTLGGSTTVCVLLSSEWQGSCLYLQEGLQYSLMVIASLCSKKCNRCWT
jgi:hypothetical protein